MYKVLSLSGGGVRGVISAVMLEEIEQRTGPLNKYFDLIAGTSTGAIIASAISLGVSAKEIVDLFRFNAQTIFPYSSLIAPERIGLVASYGVSSPKFSGAGLRDVLLKLCGNTLVTSIPTPLLLTSFDTIAREPIIFKSWRSDKFTGILLRDAIAASAAAPTYFPAHKMIIEGKEVSAIDGGVCCNDPSICAVSEAVRLGNPLESIELCSVGTGDPTRPIPFKSAEEYGALQWALNGLVDVLLESPSSVTEYAARQLLGLRYLKLQFKLDRELTGKRLNDDMDDSSPENINNLIEAARVYIKKQYLSGFFF